MPRDGKKINKTMSLKVNVFYCFLKTGIFVDLGNTKFYEFSTSSGFTAFWWWVLNTADLCDVLSFWKCLILRILTKLPKIRIYCQRAGWWIFLKIMIQRMVATTHRASHHILESNFVYFLRRSKKFLFLELHFHFYLWIFGEKRVLGQTWDRHVGQDKRRTGQKWDMTNVGQEQT